MADTETTTNVTPLRPKAKDATGAARARRFRKKRKATVTRTVMPGAPTTVTVPDTSSGIQQVEKVNDIKTSVTVAGDRPRGITLATMTAALALATVSAGFSISGMTSIFVGSFWPVIGMGIALEVGKLSAVAALPTLRRGPLKGALIALVAVLMGLNNPKNLLSTQSRRSRAMMPSNLSALMPATGNVPSGKAEFTAVAEAVRQESCPCHCHAALVAKH